MSNIPSIMSVRELIDTAFGDPQINVVNHKLIQTILVIIARQLRLLERRVEVETGPLYNVSSASSLSVTEIKMHTNVPRKKKIKNAGADSKGIMKTKTGMFENEPTQGQPTKTVRSSKLANVAVLETGVPSTMKSISEETSYLTKSSTEQSPADKSSTSKSTIDKPLPNESLKEKSGDKKIYPSQKLVLDKISSIVPTSSPKEPKENSLEIDSFDKTTLGKPKMDKTSTGARLPQDYLKRLEEIEQKREKEIRVIHQRADSREEQEKTPIPMASLDSMEKQYEKLFIVERVPTEEARRTDKTWSKFPRLSVVTQEEFEELTTAVRNLQERFNLVGTPEFPENAQLLDDMRKGASLTDAMAALQLSARIEAAEKALEKMLSLITDLAKSTPGVNIPATIDMAPEENKSIRGEKIEKETEVIYGPDNALPTPSKKSTVAKEIAQKAIKLYDQRSSMGSIVVEGEAMGHKTTRSLKTELETKQKPNWITANELDNAMQELYNDFMKIVNTTTTQSNTNANNAVRIAKRLESKLDESLNLGNRMRDLEKLVAEYVDHINILDTGLSSQMTNYQEQLTQMQHDLEVGIETMQEALANTGGDTAAMADLNNHFANLQMDFDVASMRQKELQDIQDSLAFDLQSLWNQIEILRDSKSDRDEVADALRDKAGLAALNGLVSRQEFDAVRGDFEKRIGAAYDKFNNQEIVWQKAIDEILRELNEKADWIQVVSLQDSINKYLEKFQGRINAMMDIVGEPRAAAVFKKLHRDTACLSCATPAQMELESKSKHILPAFPTTRPPTIGAEAKEKPSEDGDHRDICYSGLRIPHPIDTRSHVCRRYCGGSHTKINVAARVPVGMTINPALRQANTAVGSHGKIYMVEEFKTKKPCLPCNLPKEIFVPQEDEPADQDTYDRRSSDMTPSDYREPSIRFVRAQGDSEVSTTPPPPLNDD